MLINYENQTKISSLQDFLIVVYNFYQYTVPTELEKVNTTIVKCR